RRTFDHSNLVCPTSHQAPLNSTGFLRLSFLTSAAKPWNLSFLPLNLTAQRLFCAASPPLISLLVLHPHTQLFLSSDCPHRGSHLSRPSTSGSLLLPGWLDFSSSPPAKPASFFAGRNQARGSSSGYNRVSLAYL